MRKLLLPFSLFYWLGIVLRNWFFDIGMLKAKKADVPVISVGNLSTGGVGKTPFVEFLIEKLVPSGQLSVVSRGYGRKSTGTVIVSDGRGKITSAEMAGDEPIQLAYKYPGLIVVVDEQRVRGAKKAVELGAKMILLDDAFQHRYLHRDLDIVILTAEEILKGDVLLPAGNRREPWSSLMRSDLIAVARCADINEFEYVCAVGRERYALPVNTPIVGMKTKLKGFKHALHDEMVNTEMVSNKNIIAFSGIGNPQSFEDLLVQANVKVVRHIVFPDHHWYKENDIKIMIDARKRTNADFIVTTEKDAVRLEERFAGFLKSEPVIVAEIQQDIISGGQKLDELLMQV